ncbi:type II toxin-antitoxin system RelE/ParE family toxin [Christiangramia forsetii]|uniref:Plasmid stabilization system protein n=2 Tax=Christiangramia forsetii TaxID=411153 RepID=A0LXG4_CHRFK|nr:type II toxin-antitoxin system RelE/ParE family toxin [Christiangramia forsetii]GGG36878.1 hypothetical protein GCM10011532_20740 [Christiangramia forsetii]CAL65059.1 conserved hypothetical protein [Christiangramia forsetii KT0803]
MKYNLDFIDEVNEDVANAYKFYESKRTGLGEEFLKHLETYFDRIQSEPFHFPEKRKPYREAFIKRFPYIIVYEIVEKSIIIYAIFNTWQDPDKNLAKNI